MTWKRCPDCRQAFSGHNNSKRCPPCAHSNRNDRQRERDRARAKERCGNVERTAQARRPVVAYQYEYRADFVLAFAEMRAELKRQTDFASSMPQLLPSDPLDLPGLGAQRGTGRQGYR